MFKKLMITIALLSACAFATKKMCLTTTYVDIVDPQDSYVEMVNYIQYGDMILNMKGEESDSLIVVRYYNKRKTDRYAFRKQATVNTRKYIRNQRPIEMPTGNYTFQLFDGEWFEEYMMR